MREIGVAEWRRNRSWKDGVPENLIMYSIEQAARISRLRCLVNIQGMEDLRVPNYRIHQLMILGIEEKQGRVIYFRLDDINKGGYVRNMIYGNLPVERYEN